MFIDWFELVFWLLLDLIVVFEGKTVNEGVWTMKLVDEDVCEEEVSWEYDDFSEIDEVERIVENIDVVGDWREFFVILVIEVVCGVVLIEKNIIENSFYSVKNKKKRRKSWNSWNDYNVAVNVVDLVVAIFFVVILVVVEFVFVTDVVGSAAVF